MKFGLKDALKIGLGIATNVAPGGGAVKSVLGAVNAGLADTGDPNNEEADRLNAAANDEQNEAIVKLAQEVGAIKKHLGMT
jgi:hypothetical protein